MLDNSLPSTVHVIESFNDLTQPYLIQQYSRSIIICDHHTQHIAIKLSILTTEPTIVIPAGEPSKSRHTKAWLEDQWLRLGLCRHDLIIACGGGMILDLVGFTAATYLRGIDCLYCPTSLLAMVDASLGGKTAINACDIKNALGVFSNPKYTLIVMEALQTLPWIEKRNGIIECYKHFFLTDEKYSLHLLKNHEPIETFLNYHSADNIKQQLEIKQSFVGADPYDHNRRQMLNLGHTLGHAIESIYHVPHGVGVALGLHFIAHVSAELFNFPQEHVHAITQAWQRLNIKPPSNMCSDLLINACMNDKKRQSSTLTWVLLHDFGQPFLHSLSISQSKHFIHHWIKNHAYSLS